MKELTIYTIAAISSLFILGYTVHIFVGGLVSERTEIGLTVAVCIVGIAVIGYMYWDVIRRRRQ